MTTDVDAVLVQRGSPPDLDAERLLDVRPGGGSTFDGDRRWASLSFVYDGVYARSYGRDDVVAALEAATGHVDDGGTVRLGNRSRLRFDWSETTIRTVERGLASAARESGGRLVTWTDEPPEPDDESLYDAVVRR
ncbi:hypothetical protein BRC81_03605 [Halobacteriales archaeon QS_1_68_20]|nr:MAG: hypothetical protein BRC81_03605 [Halobacteriales archaeon QS_1_68_20]